MFDMYSNTYLWHTVFVAFIITNVRLGRGIVVETIRPTLYSHSLYPELKAEKAL